MRPTAYFSAEIGFTPSIPTYSGGLGVLAGDHLKSAADLGLPIVGVTLLYREGYFVQRLDARGEQQSLYPRFRPEGVLERLTPQVTLELDGRAVRLALWRKDVTGRSGHTVPIVFLDSDVPENAPEDRAITVRLYGGDERLRLRQEAVLGFGGLQAIDTVFGGRERLHLNEGHCAFAPLGLLRRGLSVDDVRARCHFTTHTPVPAGHDAFAHAMCREVIGSHLTGLPVPIETLAGAELLSMSHLALSLCGTANGVSQRHGEVSRAMFPRHPIGHITNGVHHLSWVSPPLAALFDAHIAGWRERPALLAERAADLPGDALWEAHLRRKRELLEYVDAETQQGFAPYRLTLGFARRAASYKRAALLFSDPARLVEICGDRVQLVFAGKAHPRDEQGQEVIRAVFRGAAAVEGRVRVCYLANYNMWSGALITSGCDAWLNSPRPPREASGTSGMKATLNGVPNVSIADGWWAEAARDGENGWLFGAPRAPGDAGETSEHDAADADALYRTLAERVLPAFADRARWLAIMRQAIATGAAFTSERMVQDYAERYYR